MNTDAMTRKTTTELRIMLRMAYPGNAEKKTETRHLKKQIAAVRTFRLYKAVPNATQAELKSATWIELVFCLWMLWYSPL